MTITKNKPKTARNLTEVSENIENMVEFKHKSMHAEIHDQPISSRDAGRLSEELLNQLNKLIVGERVYVVYSYQTPIAWIGTVSNTTTIAGQKHSQTTTHHQNLTTVALVGRL